MLPHIPSLASPASEGSPRTAACPRRAFRGHGWERPGHQGTALRGRPSGGTTCCRSRSKKHSRTSKARLCEGDAKPGRLRDPTDIPSGRGAREAHLFVAFLAYCLHVTLARRLHALAPGLTPRSVFENFAAMQMIDVHLATPDGREVVLTPYTEPDPELTLFLNKLKLDLPAPPPPKITAGTLDSPPPM